MTKVSVDVKGQLWWIAAFLWGWVTVLTVLSLHPQIDLFNLGLFIGVLLLGAILSIPAARRYRSGGFTSSPPEPLSVQFSDTPEDKGVYSVRVVGVQKTKVGPRLKHPSVGPLRYAAWWTFVRAPLLIGDWILSSLWSALGNVDTGGLPGVDKLPGFGSGVPRASLLDEARKQGLIDPDDEVGTNNPYVGDF